MPPPPRTVAPTTQAVVADAALPHPGVATGALVSAGVFTAGYPVLRKGLTPEGVAHAWFLGASIYSAFGAGGFFLVCLYFIFGTLVSEEGRPDRQWGSRASVGDASEGPARQAVAVGSRTARLRVFSKCLLNSVCLYMFGYAPPRQGGGRGVPRLRGSYCNGGDPLLVWESGKRG